MNTIREIHEAAIALFAWTRGETVDEHTRDHFENLGQVTITYYERGAAAILAAVRKDESPPPPRPEPSASFRKT